MLTPRLSKVIRHGTKLRDRLERVGIPHVSRSGRFDIRNLNDPNWVVIVVEIANMKRKQTIEAVISPSSRDASLCPL